MNKTDHTPNDPLRTFFESQWAASCTDEHLPFSEEVIKKIRINKYKEQLFYVVCVSMALMGMAAMALFVYSGYNQLGVVASEVAAFAAETARSFTQMFRPQPEPALISIPLLIYLSLLTILLSGLDWFLRGRRQTYI